MSDELINFLDDMDLLNLNSNGLTSSTTVPVVAHHTDCVMKRFGEEQEAREAEKSTSLRQTNTTRSQYDDMCDYSSSYYPVAVACHDHNHQYMVPSIGESNSTCSFDSAPFFLAPTSCSSQVSCSPLSSSPSSPTTSTSSATSSSSSQNGAHRFTASNDLNVTMQTPATVAAAAQAVDVNMNDFLSTNLIDFLNTNLTVSNQNAATTISSTSSNTSTLMTNGDSGESNFVGSDVISDFLSSCGSSLSNLPELDELMGSMNKSTASSPFVQQHHEHQPLTNEQAINTTRFNNTVYHGQSEPLQPLTLSSPSTALATTTTTTTTAAPVATTSQYHHYHDNTSCISINSSTNHHTQNAIHNNNSNYHFHHNQYNHNQLHHQHQHQHQQQQHQQYHHHHHRHTIPSNDTTMSSMTLFGGSKVDCNENITNRSGAKRAVSIRDLPFNKTWNRMTEQERSRIIEYLTKLINDEMDLREQLEIIRILNNDARLKPTDNPLIINLQVIDDQKFRQIKEVIQLHNLSVLARSTGASNHHLDAKREWRLKRAQERLKQKHKKEQRQLLKETKSGLFNRTQIISVAYEEHETDVDILS